MKLAVALLFVFCYAECRKIVPIDKNANLAFINMEGGGGARPPTNTRPAAIEPMKPAGPGPVPVPSKPGAAPAPAPIKPASPPASPTVAKPPTPTPKPAAPAPAPAKPAQPTPPTQIKPKPVNPAPVANPITTPGPGSVKQLINFYDSQGKASPIRPYSYSQAVKQG
ncbi:uncharacterized protein LOC126375033 [Pectinophora gossypiella]|uniref:uncharacterized protein LOC126375033 n=1 Tax=Pectinophora gossypiella TaxID=13191 RepID=UPI00214F201E|nr:uncharacterized protein LOC126375033 [Pectinophora gossypiella]